MFAYPTGEEGARNLGYDPAILADADPALLASFCGVGNPFTLVEIRPGAVVLDVGSGAGFDLYVAARLAGPAGSIFGVDLTEAMVELAEENLRRAGIANAGVVRVDSEDLPFGENTFDAVISNGVINLSPDKDRLYSELFRVLKPGGKLGYADVVLDQEQPANTPQSAEAWAQ